MIETDYDTVCEKYLYRRLCTKRINNGSTQQEFFAITPGELDPILDEASAYLRDNLPVIRDAKTIAAQESDGSVKTPGNEEQSIYQELLELEEQSAKLDMRRDYLESRLKVAIGTAEVLDGIAVWKTQTITQFDVPALKQQEPATYSRYLKDSKSRPFRLSK